MTITKPQAIAMAALLALGLAGTAAVLLRGHEHAEEEHHAEEAAPRRVALSDTQRDAAGITLHTAGPAPLQLTTSFPGEIRLNDDRTAHVVPRLAGVAEAVPAQLGQAVRRGDLLAVIASPALAEQRSELLNAQRRQQAARVAFEREDQLWRERIAAAQDREQAQTALREADIAVANAQQKLAAVGASASSRQLNRLELRAPFDGVVIEKHLALGEAVKDDASIFTVADLGSVWAEFAVAAKDVAGLRVGQRAVVTSTAFDGRAEGLIAYVGALLGDATRTARARVLLANPQGGWRPGLFVTMTVQGGEAPVAVAVPADAVQTMDAQSVVFKAVAGGFEPVAVKTGRSDGQLTEITAGLQAGERVAAKNAFVLKAELGKASASHEH
jgi:cobalt-zinc-cadmium efflux system membrane fusion protein